MRFIITIVFVLASVLGMGQADSTGSSMGSFGKRLVYGGNLGLSFGTVTVVNLSPSVGYKVTEKLVVGPGITYIYYNDSRFDFTSQVYGGRLWGQYLFTRNLFAYGEYDVLNGEFDPLDGGRRVTVASPLLGAGYFQGYGPFGFSLMVLWNFNDSRYQPYGPNPIFRGGFNIGL